MMRAANGASGEILLLLLLLLLLYPVTVIILCLAQYRDAGFGAGGPGARGTIIIIIKYNYY